MYYDTHCHPYLAKEKSQEEILENFFNWWGKYLNSIWCDLESSQISINLAHKYPGVYASIWIHPTHCLDYIDNIQETINELEKLYHKHADKIVAIWEIWLDYHWINSLSKKYSISEEKVIIIQKEFFRAQISLSKKLNLPIIIHNRSSADDVLDILIEMDCKDFVFHCYSEDLVYANRLLDHSPKCMLWFGGVTTFKSALWVQEAAQNIPLDNIMIETDSPYLTPSPFRWKEENEPILVKYILSKIIDLRNEKPEDITRQVFENSIKFFVKKNNS